MSSGRIDVRFQSDDGEEVVTTTMLTCDRYYTTTNLTSPVMIVSFAGIPENFLFCFITWIVLLLIFSVLRKAAWDYGRLNLINRAEKQSLVGPNDYTAWMTLFYEDKTEPQGAAATGGQQKMPSDQGEQGEQGRESIDTSVKERDQGLCSWIMTLFTIKDDDILAKIGQDGVHYMVFQRYLIVFLSLTALLCMLIILPVNITQGDMEASSFGRTTITNIHPNSPVLWLHCAVSVLLLVAAFGFMKRFSSNLQYIEESRVLRTLMIYNIPRDRSIGRLIQQHFHEAYPEMNVVDIQFAYNLSRLYKTSSELQRASDGLNHSQDLLQSTGIRPLMFPYSGAYCWCCDCCIRFGAHQVDCIEFYTHEMTLYKDLYETEKAKTLNDFLGIAFVTFEDEQMALRIHTDFRRTCKGTHNLMTSSVSRDLSVRNWRVSMAPAPDNIYWENLAASNTLWYIKAFFVNGFIFIVFFFLTTPSILLSKLDTWHVYQEGEQDPSSAFVVSFVPSILICVTFTSIPLMVYFSDNYLGYWTKTARHHAIFRKTYIALITMTLILPSLGLVSLHALLQWMAMNSKAIDTFRWECIFVSENFAYFVNYIISMAFVGSACDLARLPALLVYCVKLGSARSAAEVANIRKSMIFEFSFGIQYAYSLCVFTVTVCYCITCPIITVFGLMCQVMKYHVDRYNMFFVYSPSKLSLSAHTTAINFVLIALVVQQLQLLTFIILRADNLRAINIFALVALFITLAIFFGRLFCECLWPTRVFNSPAAYKRLDGQPEAQPKKHVFVPSLLVENSELFGAGKHNANDDISTPRSYGAVAEAPPITSQAAHPSRSSASIGIEKME